VREFLTQVFGIVFCVIDNDYQYEIINMKTGRLEMKEDFRYRYFRLIQAFLIFVFVVSFVARGVFAQQPDSSPRLLVHLLEYLAADYSGAVKDRKVVNRSEYEEQLEFGESSVRIAKDLAAEPAYALIVGKTEKLQRLIAEKADGVDVANLARAIKQEVLSISQLSISPAIWPNLKNGEHLFSTACANCHGSSGRGDGPGGRCAQRGGSDGTRGQKEGRHL
jgi:high-affinity iron transporter